VKALFAEVTENECIIESTYAIYIQVGYPFTVTTHWHMYVVVLSINR